MIKGGVGTVALGLVLGGVIAVLSIHAPLAAAASLVSALAVAAWIAHPRFTLSALLSLIVLAPPAMIFPVVSMVALVSIGSALMRSEDSPQLALMIVGALAGAILCSAVVAGFPGEATEQLQRYAAFLALFLLGSSVPSDRTLGLVGSIAFALAIWSCAASALGIAPELAFVPDKNLLGAFIGMLAPVVLVNARRLGVPVLGVVLLGALMTGGVLATESRGALLGLGAAGVSALGIHIGGRQGVFTALLVSGSVTLLVWAGIIALPTDRNAVVRVELWRNAIEGIKTHPAFGIGPGAVPDFIQANFADRALIQSQLDKLGHVHNAYMQALLELGVVGGVLLLGVLLVAAYMGIRHQHRLAASSPTLAPALALTAYLGQTTVDSFGRSYTIQGLAFLLAGLILGHAIQRNGAQFKQLKHGMHRKQSLGPVTL
jgi:O-antigen ligase